MAMHFNLADMIEAVADRVPDREALVCGNRRATYAQLDERATQLAHFLQSRGVQAGNNVGLYMYNCVEYLEAMLACFKLRAVPINVNYRYVDDELRYIFDNADLVACVLNRQFVPHLAVIADSVSDLKACIAVEDGSEPASASSPEIVEFEQALQGQPAQRDFAERSEDDLFILYTGGTTGLPKGVIWSHKALLFAAMGGGGHFSPLGPCEKASDIVSRIAEQPVTGIALAPLMHGASWWYACIQLLAGNKLVLNHHHSLNGEQVWDICEREKINALQIVGDAMAIPLLDALEANPGRWDLSTIFGMSSGGAVFSQVKQDGFRAHFPGIRIINSFGSSESGQMGADSGSRKPEGGLGNVTRSAFMDVILEEDGTHRKARAGERGIFARSGHIPEGYYGDPEKTARTFIVVEGKRWLLTGDEARLEGDDTITVFGRGSNCINSGGEKVFPEEVEDALKAHASIFDALVVGTPDPRWGNRVLAVVQLREGRELSLDAIQTHCRKHIAGYKIPRALVLVDKIPRSPSGKPDYKTASRIAHEQSESCSA